MSSPEPSGPVAIVGATIIDGNGGPPLPNGVVIVHGGRIAAVGDTSSPIPADARQIAAAGQYVIPGLMDANVHLFFACLPDALVRYEDRYEDIVTEAAQVALREGLTTVFDTWGPRQALVHVRDRIRAGSLPGSRMFVAGNIIGLGGPASDDFFAIARTILSKSEADAIDERWEQGVGADLLWMTEAEVRARIRRYAENGQVDMLKYAASGHKHMEFITFSAEVQRAIVEEGHRAGMTVQAHTTSPESLRMEIEAGVDLLQHPDVTGPVAMPEATVARIAQLRVPCCAMFTTRRFLAWNAAHGKDPMKTFHAVKDGNDRRLIEAGAELLLTTDAGIFPPNVHESPLMGESASAEDSPTELGEAHFRWLQAAQELGMRPMDALMAATRNIARAYKVDSEIGTLEAGKRADLLLLERNPLENAANYRTIRMVMKDGEVVRREALPLAPVLTAPRA